MKVRLWKNYCIIWHIRTSSHCIEDHSIHDKIIHRSCFWRRSIFGSMEKWPNYRAGNYRICIVSCLELQQHHAHHYAQHVAACFKCVDKHSFAVNLTIFYFLLSIHFRNRILILQALRKSVEAFRFTCILLHSRSKHVTNSLAVDCQWSLQPDGKFGKNKDKTLFE